MNPITIETITVTVNKTQHTITVADLPSVSLNKLLQYGGQRWVNDHVNGLAKAARDDGDSMDYDAWTTSRMDDLKTGVFRSGGGGKSIEIPLQATRDVVRGWMVKNMNYTKATADKEAKSEENCRNIVRLHAMSATAQANDTTVDAVDPALVDKTFENMWGRISADIADRITVLTEREQQEAKDAAELAGDLQSMVAKAIK